MKIHGFAAIKEKEPLTPFEYDAAPLAPFEIEVKISHCGICHSDIHLINNDWGISEYPFIPGHEIIGTVTAVGSCITHLKLTERVGIGWQRSSCMNCDYCLSGQENLCPSSQATCVGHHGGFADYIRTDGRFAFPIPDTLSSETAAPLLCAGVTVFAPMRTHGINARMNVGIIGIGGLGHLALQFAHAFGCEVTAFSTSPSKKEEARRLGADHFINTSAATEMTKAQNSFDFILSTVSADINWEDYLTLLKPRGTLCIVGVAPHPLQIPAFALIGGAKTISGSAIGSRSAMREMLAFAARHNIEAQIESMKLPQVNEALGHVRANKARYRMVLSI